MVSRREWCVGLMTKEWQVPMSYVAGEKRVMMVVSRTGVQPASVDSPTSKLRMARVTARGKESRWTGSVLCWGAGWGEGRGWSEGGGAGEEEGVDGGAGRRSVEDECEPPPRRQGWRWRCGWVAML